MISSQLLSSHIENVDEHNYILGVSRQWGEKARLPRPPRYIEIRHASIGNKVGSYAVPDSYQSKDLFSLSALLESCDAFDNAFFFIDLPDNKYWFTSLIGGMIQPASDIIWSRNTQDEDEILRNRIQDAEQSVDEGMLLRFNSVAELVQTLDRKLESDVLEVGISRSILKGKPQVSFSITKRLTIAIGFFALATTGVLVFQEIQASNTQAAAEAVRIAQANTQFKNSISSYERSIPSHNAIAYVKRATSFPFNKFGAQASLIICEYSICTYSYTTANSGLISPSIQWAKSIDPGSEIDFSTGVFKFNRSINSVLKKSGEIRKVPKITSIEAELQWANFRSGIRFTGANLTWISPAFLPGAEIIRKSMKSGEWTLADIPYQYVPAIAEGLNKIPGAGITYLRAGSNTMTLGGVYAIQ